MVYCLNKPHPAAGISKFHICPRSLASRLNVHCLDNLSRGHYQPICQQAGKGFIYFITLPLIFFAIKPRFNTADSSASSMFSSSTGIFLSFLHAKVGRERLVYFIVSNHSVEILYVIKWLGLDLPRTKFQKSVYSWLFYLQRHWQRILLTFFCFLE